MTVGVNFFGMHYAHNSTYFTYGQGGYFSPQAYFLASVPITMQVEQGWNLRYTVTGAFGVQAFQEDSVPYFPLDPALEVANNNPSFSAQTVVSGNYDLKAEAAYHLSDHWYAGGFADLNNTRDYNNQVVGFYVRFLIRPQVPSDNGSDGAVSVGWAAAVPGAVAGARSSTEDAESMEISGECRANCHSGPDYCFRRYTNEGGLPH